LIRIFMRVRPDFVASGVFEQNNIENIALELHACIMKDSGKSEEDILFFLKQSGCKINKEHQTLVFSKNYG